MPDPPRIPPPDVASRQADDLAAAILDGEAVDWPAADSAVGNETAEEFRVLQALAAVHRHPADANATTSSGATGLARAWPPSPGAWGRLTQLVCVGEGSFGKVYRAWDPALQRHVALKLLPASTVRASTASALNEARLLARVRHPHVLTVYGAERLDGQVGIWTEFIDGRTLDEIEPPLS